MDWQGYLVSEYFVVSACKLHKSRFGLDVSNQKGFVLDVVGFVMRGEKCPALRADDVASLLHIARWGGLQETVHEEVVVGRRYGDPEGTVDRCILLLLLGLLSLEEERGTCEALLRSHFKYLNPFK